MSDPVSNSEIEDVLASIRRLVSENAKALKGDRGRDPEAEKLVLTPALRIDESEAPAVQADVFAVDTETWNDVSGKVEAPENKGIFSHQDQRRPAVLDAADGAVTPEPDAAEGVPDGVVPEAGPAPGADGAGAAEGAAMVAAGGDDTAAGVPDAGPQVSADAESAPAATVADLSGATELEQRIAELETAMDRLPVSPQTGSAAATEAGQHGEEAVVPAVETVDETAPEPAGDTDLAAAEVTAQGGAPGTDTAEAADTGETAAPEDAREASPDDGPAPAPSDAPPRSWIEGLVAAAAAAEAARLAERAKARGEATTHAAPEAMPAAEDARGADEAGTGADAAVDVAEAGADDSADESTAESTAESIDASADDGTDASPADSTDESPAEVVDDAADTGPFELGEAHAVAPEALAEAPEAAQTDTDAPAGAQTEPEPEPESAAQVEAPVAEALGSVPETGDLPETEELSDETAETAESITIDAPEVGGVGALAPEAGSGATGPEETGPEESVLDETGLDETGLDETGPEAAGGPERSWVDRLIAAAATLRNGPEPAEAGETADEQSAGETGEDAAALEEPAGEAEVEEMQAGAPDESDAPEAEGTAEDEAPLTLEPFNLVDPIAPGGEPEAAVPEWEPVETPDADERDAGEPVLDMDSVLTGPWTAAAVHDAATDALDAAHTPSEAEDAASAAPEGAVEEGADPGDTDLAEEAAAEEVAADEAADEALADAEAADAAAPVGALEWEPVELSDLAATETDTAPEADEPDRIGAGADDVETSDPDNDPGVAEDIDIAIGVASQDIDGQDESERDLEEALLHDGPYSAVDEIGAPDEIGETDDTDEIAADAAAVAAAAEAEADWEDAGMAAAGVAMAAAGPGPQALADENAAPDAAADDIRAARDGAGHEDEAVIDEAMLRELVAQLVRDELQGTVGERITHNVRKLIRREIARALTLQDFEK